MTVKNSKGMRRPAPLSAPSDASGYAMAVLLVGLAVMLTLMTMAMPVWRQQARREREEELLFRLKQYAHALALYQRRVPGASPADLDVLVKERYLRRKYKDPVTGKDFAILRVGQVSPGMTTPLPGQVGAGAPTTGAPGGPSSQPTGGTPGRSSGFGQSPMGTMNQPGSPGAMVTGPIRGVVSTSKESSLRIWKGRTQYDQWEVAIEDVTPRFFGPQPDQPGQNRGPGGVGSRQPGRPGAGSPQMQPRTSSPTTPYGGPR